MNYPILKIKRGLIILLQLIVVNIFFLVHHRCINNLTSYSIFNITKYFLILVYDCTQVDWFILWNKFETFDIIPYFYKLNFKEFVQKFNTIGFH